MSKEKKNGASAGESSANELLRQLRAQYDNQDAADEVIDRPGDVFEGTDAIDPVGEDDEITRRIMEMFSSVDAVGADAEAASEKEESKDDTTMDEPDEMSDMILAMPEDIEVEAEDDTDESVHDFEDEVSDTALPDFDDAPEEALPPEPVPQVAKASEADEIRDAVLSALFEDIADVPAADNEQSEPELAPAVSAMQETVEAAGADENSAEAETPAVAEQKEAAEIIEINQTSEVSEVVEQVEKTESTDHAEEITAPPPEDAPTIAADAETATEQEETDADAVAPVLLREDEVLLDEFEKLPPSAEPSSEPAAQAEPSQPSKPILERAEEENRPKQITPRPSPLDAALSAQRKKHEAERSKHSAELRAAESLSEDDVLLLLRMGYENELREQCTPKELQNAEKHLHTAPLTEKQKAHLAFGYRDASRNEGEEAAVKGDYFTREYTRIKENYRKDAAVMVWRVILTAIFVACTLAIDLLPLYSAYLPAPWSGIAQGAEAHLLGLQLLVLCAIPSLRRLGYGLRQLLRLSPEPISVVLPALVLNVVYDIIMALQPTQYALLNFPTALMLLLCVLGESMDLKRERLAFSVVASAESKVVLQKVPPRKKKVVRGGEVVKIINDDADRTHYRVTRAEHIDDYFYRTNAPTRRYRNLLPLLALQGLLSLGVTGVSTLRLGVDLRLLSVLMLTVQMCTPAVYAISFAVSLLFVCKRLSARGITILGQSTVDEMTEDKMLIYDDTEMLHAKSSTEITVKGSGDPKRYVRYARRLFYALGGTLGKINTSDLSEDRMDGLVEILRVHADGVEARLDGRVRALMGSSSFMVRNNIRVPNAGAEMAARKNEQSSILYLAFGGQIRLGYEINYSIHGSFEQTVATLCRGQSAVAILSHDPCITEEYLTQGRSAKKHPVRVIKPVRHEPKRVLPRVSSGIVALKNARAVADAVRSCEQLPQNDRTCTTVQWALCFAAAVCALALVWVGVAESLLSVVCALLIGVFSLPIHLLCTKGIAQGEASPKGAAPRRSKKK